MSDSKAPPKENRETVPFSWDKTFRTRPRGPHTSDQDPKGLEHTMHE